MVDAQKYVNKNFPNKAIRRLNISSKGLSGHLDLTGYTVLEELDCGWNQLTSLDLSKCVQLRIINCRDNELINLNFSGCPNLKEIHCSNQLTNLNFLATLPHPENIIRLNLNNNPLMFQTLDYLAVLVNLKYLDLKNTKFHGSLAPLQNLVKLKKLRISWTKLDSDIELLPANLQTILAKNMPKIAEKIKINDFGEYGEYDYQVWRQANLWKVVQTYSLEQKQELTKLDLSNQQTPNNNLEFLSDFIKLEYLNLANNSFSGSLQFLQNLTKLKKLNISNTNLDSGLEHLPPSLETLICEAKGNPFNLPKVNKIRTLLKPYRGDIQAWRQANNNPLLAYQTQLQAKEQQIQELKAQIAANLTNQIEVERLQNELKTKEQELKVLQAKYNELLNHELAKSLTEKEEQLTKLQKSLKLHKSELFILNKALEAEAYLASCDISSERHHYRKTKDENISHLKEQGCSAEKLTKLCALQNEITHLKLQLAAIKGKKSLAITEGQKAQYLLEANSYPIYMEELIKRIDNFLQTKQAFLKARQTTINKLQNCCDILESNTLIGEYAKREEQSKVITTIGKTLNNFTFSLIEAAGEGIALFNARHKRKFSLQNSQEFQAYLKEEENDLALLTASYDSLLSILQQHPELEITNLITNLWQLEANSLALFQTEYQVYEIATNIWENKAILTADDMKNAIAALTQNRQVLHSELNQQTKAFDQIRAGIEQQKALIVQSPQ